MSDKCKECGKELHFYNKAAGKFKGLCSSCAWKKGKVEIKKASKEANKEWAKVKEEATPESVKKFVNITDERTFAKSFDSVHEAVIQAINKMGWKIKSQDKNKIECGKGMGLLSMGSNITITLGKSGGGIKVGILSKDVMGVAGSLGGNWQSKKNIKKFFEEIEKRLILMK